MWDELFKAYRPESQLMYRRLQKKQTSPAPRAFPNGLAGVCKQWCSTDLERDDHPSGRSAPREHVPAIEPKELSFHFLHKGEQAS